MIEKVKEQVYELLGNDDSGHGIDHVNRVLELALRFAREEEVNLDVVQLIALLHDVDDYKLFGKEAADMLPNARLFMNNANVKEEIQLQVLDEISRIGYGRRLNGLVPITIEGKIVSDADMCDTAGVNGIFRIYTYVTKHGKPFFDKNMFPVENMNSSKYTRICADSGVCHIFEKVLRLKDMMLTKSGKNEMKKRCKITIDILYQLFDEENAPEWIEYLDKYLKENS